MASGCHGLVAKATDEPGTYQWSSTYFNTWAFASGIYGGAQNTKKSIARAVASASTCPAASVCDNLTSGGYTDWYLPSKDELDMMYVNLHMQGLGGFANLTIGVLRRSIPRCVGYSISAMVTRRNQ